MTVFLLVFTLLSLFMAAMAVGVIFSNKPIKGSCGGLGSLGLKEDCPICGGDPGARQASSRAASSDVLFYDASTNTVPSALTAPQESRRQV